MIICFWNNNHIGDIYFDSIFLHYICKLNSNVQFYYYWLQGDAFVNNILNLSRIFGNKEYTHNLTEGMPPECAIDMSLANFLGNNMGHNTHLKVLNCNGEDVLFLNTWCNPMGFVDFELSTAIPSWKKTIELINNTYGTNLLFNRDVTANELISGFNIKNPIIEPGIDEFMHSVRNKKLFFIYNYHPRSVHFDMNKLNSYIRQVANNADNFVFLATENNEFNAYPNIKCCETDFHINKQLSCKNLLQLWNIAKKCNTIIIMPSGSSWTFFHNLDDLKNKNIYIFNSQLYTDRLNANIQLICNDSSYCPIQNYSH